MLCSKGTERCRTAEQRYSVVRSGLAKVRRGNARRGEAMARQKQVQRSIAKAGSCYGTAMQSSEQQRQCKAHKGDEQL